LRIALFGYENEHEIPGWVIHRWNAGQGFGGQAKQRSQNGKREAVWLSPHCLGSQASIFD
jgi:hypothetical protein